MKFDVLLCLLLSVGLLSGKSPEHTFVLNGFVRDEAGRGIEGVVVNNGVNFTRTGRNGSWKLVTDTTASKFVAISTPREYELPQKDGLAYGFYKPIRMAVQNRENIFTLKKRAVMSDKCNYIAISDPQVENAHDMRRWTTETVPDLMRTAAILRKKGDVVAMTLGDLVFDNMQMYSRYASSLKNKQMTVFQCVGNHDLDKRYADLHNSEEGAHNYAEQLYGHFFGPSNYSFNIGKTHIITMKNINYRGGYKYEEELTEADLEWLRKDLSYVPKDILVIMNMHAPAWNNMERQDNITDAQRLEEVLSSHNVHVFCGHTHFFENVEVSPRLYQHNISAACGAWWSSNVGRCGAPNGYMVVPIDGTHIMWYYKGTRLKTSYQMRVYKPKTFRTQYNYVVANVWDYDPHCRVTWYEDGKYKGRMQQFTAEDETFLRTKPLRSQRVKTAHLFRAKPAPKYRTVKVVYTNRFGQNFSYTIVNRNNRPFLTD